MTPTRLALAARFVIGAALPAGATDVERRVKFGPGETSMNLPGTIGPPKVRRMGEVRDRYILRAKKGQALTVNFTATKPIMIQVWHTDYNQGYLFNKEGASGVVTKKLPATADYYIDVEVSGATKSANYDLNLAIQ